MKILQKDATNEDAYQAIVRNLWRQGERDRAIRYYHQCVEMLKKEWGASPSSELKELYLKIIDGRKIEE